MNKSLFKALLAFGCIVSPVLATPVGEQLAALKTAAYSEDVTTANLAEQIRTYNIKKDGDSGLVAEDSLYQAAAMILNGAASNVIAKEAALVASGAGNLEDKARVHSAKIEELNAIVVAAMNVNIKLRPYVQQTEDLLTGDSAASSWTKTIIYKGRQLVVRVSDLWAEVTQAAREALTTAVAAVDGQIEAVVNAITGCALRPTGLRSLDVSRR